MTYSSIDSVVARMQVDSSSYQDVKYILVDPSCSGSGILNRMEYDQSVSCVILHVHFEIQCMVLPRINLVTHLPYSTQSLNKYRRHRSLSTYAYWNNSEDMGAKKRVGTY